MWVPNMPVTIVSAIAAGAGAICIFKDLYGGTPYDRAARAHNKTIVITGANDGIGNAAAWDFARRGAKVFMACRDMEKCEASRKEIVLETGNKYVYCRPCDLASLDSVRQFVERFKTEEPRIDALVTNAAVMEPPVTVTRDGFEAHLGINHLGHFLLTNLLLDTLKASAPSRVIVVTCSGHKSGKLNKDNLNLTGEYSGSAAYAQSKLANLLFASELAKRTLGTGVAVVAVDPGLTDTNLSRHLPMSKSWSRYIIYPLFYPIMKTPKIGAQVIVHAALDPKLQKCVGDYYVQMMRAEPSEEAQNFELAHWLWKVSEKWTRLDQHRAELAKAA
ncbi:retinol dehydrogenase 13-like [Plodia interpunctella]|uniref:retinol dehydrogenase 13-like n=1 Tax=Plodia interpunctella TaxID=58824 RepID=UPI0023685FCB|nr:retinol dehydrogenase 13-like [Plodia interpunctella]